MEIKNEYLIRFRKIQEVFAKFVKHSANLHNAFLLLKIVELLVCASKLWRISDKTSDTTFVNIEVQDGNDC